MSRRQVATAEQMRAHASAVAATLGHASVGRAQVGDATTALACQWIADVNRVAVALWNRAGVTADTHAVFFDLAEKVLTAAGDVNVDAGAPAAALLTEVRAAFSQACAALNIPLVFPPATHLGTLYTPVDLRAMREQILHGATPAEYVAAKLAQARTSPGPVGFRAGVDAYLVDAAARTGDDLMLTAAARMIALSTLPPATDASALTAAVRELLGPVEWVRAQPYVAGAV